MRVLAIGLGGAGNRVVNRLYDHDRRSKVFCMSALAIDLDANTLLQLDTLPSEAQVFFPPIDPSNPYDVERNVDIEEVMTRIQRVDTVEIDAIMIFAGLGGTMVDLVPLIMPQMRETFLEPIFAVVTLPRTEEGKKRSAKAADDLEMIHDLFDATIVFDNETWYQKIRSSDARAITDPFGTISYTRNPRLVNSLLNEQIARRIGLLLRAGEFNNEGLDVGELVLDAGEVLNTLTGMGTVAVGYAVERLHSSPLDVLSFWKTARQYMEGSHKRAARIVKLAKKAIYEEISVPCDLTSAEKALVLVAGPSQELSLKGFVTVRKWVDRSIAGLEMRSGDYPVKNTKFVGIIIALSGVQNVPRIEELKVLRDEYRRELEIEAMNAEAEAEAEAKALVSADELEAESRYWEAPGDPLAPPVASSPGGDRYSMPEQYDVPERHDEMLNLGGGGKPRKRKDDDETLKISLSSDHLTQKDDDDRAVMVPGVGKQAPRDITRMTAIDLPQAPKDSALGATVSHTYLKKPKEVDFREIKIDAVPMAKDEALTGEHIHLRDTVRPANDEVFKGGGVNLKDVVKKAKDDILDGKKVKLSDFTTPVDSVLRGGKISPKKAPKEIVPGKGKISVIKNEEEEEEQADGIDWIT
ncbi:cell division GTPase FtsZ [Methanofollis sp. W23]|uniref:tubulin/FtsZ family protein n=1 Tax=Methanofollis sp. W23 TaxID=2817849 RepID=UPI001AE7928A|nr:tubulin/FtsZ family protein [Methanofollis sp. W23]MBP2146558.1 cell division GTPase FtsZ [Methanofollis sp. W23]